MSCLYDIDDFDYPWYLANENIHKMIEIANGARDATVILLDSCIDTDHVAFDRSLINNECLAFDFNINEAQSNYERFIKSSMNFKIDNSVLLCDISGDVFEIKTKAQQLNGISNYLYKK